MLKIVSLLSAFAITYTMFELTDRLVLAPNATLFLRSLCLPMSDYRFTDFRLSIRDFRSLIPDFWIPDFRLSIRDF